MLARIAFVLAVGAASATPVRVSPMSDEGPAASGGWFAWMQSATPNPHPPFSTTHVYVRHGDGPIVRVGPANRYAQTGGIDGRRLVLQVYDAGRSRIGYAELPETRVHYYGAAVNTTAWQWRPSVSGSWLLFGRIELATRTYEIVLANTVSGDVRVLANVRGHGAYAAPGQVNGDWATWISCPDNDCRAFRYRISSRRALAMPVLGGPAYWHFGVSVSRTGVTYFGVGRGCADVRLVRYRGGRITTLLRLTHGHAFQYSYVDDAGRRRPRILFDRTGCARSALSDIYAVVDRR
jgi:hypothetical protein